VQAEVKALATCEGRVVNSKLPRDTICRSEPKTAAVIAKARAKLVATVAKACGGKDKTCGAGSDDVSLTDAGWDIGICPDVEGGSCANIITDCGDVAACVSCIGEVAIDQAIALPYDSLVPTDPRDKADKARNRCQATIGHAATTFLTAKSKALTKCWLAVSSGNATGSCPEADGAVAGAIAKAVSKEISAICKVCGGADRACGGGDDLTPAELGFVSPCPSVQPPGGARSCAHAVASLQDIVDCIDCVTGFAVECAASATVPGLTNYPLECAPYQPVFIDKDSSARSGVFPE